LPAEKFPPSYPQDEINQDQSLVGIMLIAHGGSMRLCTTRTYFPKPGQEEHFLFVVFRGKAFKRVRFAPSIPPATAKAVWQVD
jgi:hypothetical protein